MARHLSEAPQLAWLAYVFHHQEGGARVLFNVAMSREEREEVLLHAHRWHVLDQHMPAVCINLC